MYSAINPVMPRFSPQLLKTAGRLMAEPTSRVETPPVVTVRPGLPAPHIDAVLSAALGSQVLSARSLANGDRRRLDDYADIPCESSLLA